MMPYLRRSVILVPASLLLPGCQLDDHAPTVDLLGSYFPVWMICIVSGIVLTLAARQLFIGFKLDAYLRPAPLLYLCLAISFTLAVWLMFFRN
jgi:hypothetical protein